jgi:hypothetical protein
MHLSRIFNQIVARVLEAVAWVDDAFQTHFGARPDKNAPSSSPSQNETTTPSVTPITRVHSHNDYEHKRPLFDALDNGFTSIEADIYLVNGQLLVAHSPIELKPERTLEALYLKPLMDLVQQNKGHVYSGSAQNVQLLIDIKTDNNSTYRALEALLAKYKDMFTSYNGSTVNPSAISVVISGNRPDPAVMQAPPVRYAAYDGTLADIGKPATLVPLVSDDWYTKFKWNGTGDMPALERQKLAGFVSAAHAHGQKIRFWNAPDTPAAWKELLAANVDYINTDHLPELRAWVLQNDPQQPANIKNAAAPGKGPGPS